MQWIMGTADIRESFHWIQRYQTVSVVQVKCNALSRAPKNFLWYMVEIGCKSERRKSWVRHHILSCLCNSCFQLHTWILLTGKLVICADWIAFWFAVNFIRSLQLFGRNDLSLACMASRQMTKSAALRQIQTDKNTQLTMICSDFWNAHKAHSDWACIHI